MKVLRPIGCLVLLMLPDFVSTAGFHYIKEATRAGNFSPDVESLWQQAELGFFRKDENGNFERFIRAFGQSRNAIELMASRLEIQLNLDITA